MATEGARSVARNVIGVGRVVHHRPEFFDRSFDTGYGRCSVGETVISRDKPLIGPKLRARNLSAQSGEIARAVPESG